MDFRRGRQSSGCRRFLIAPRNGKNAYCAHDTEEQILDAIDALPDDASLDQIAERVTFLSAVQKGLDQLDRGEGIPHEEVKRQLAAWLRN